MSERGPSQSQIDRRVTLLRLRLRFDIHCQYWKSTVHVTYTIDFQYWQWISKRSLRINFACFQNSKLLSLYFSLQVLSLCLSSRFTCYGVHYITDVHIQLYVHIREHTPFTLFCANLFFDFANTYSSLYFVFVRWPNRIRISGAWVQLQDLLHARIFCIPNLFFRALCRDVTLTLRILSLSDFILHPIKLDLVFRSQWIFSRIIRDLGTIL